MENGLQEKGDKLEFNGIPIEIDKDKIIASIKGAVEKEFVKRFEWDLSAAVSGAVTEFINKEIVPEVAARLTADKQFIVEAAYKTSSAVVEKMVEAIGKQVAENLSSRYRLEQVVKALIG